MMRMPMDYLSIDCKRWYALRTSFGNEKRAYQYILSKGGTAYCPTIMIDKLVEGRVKSVEIPRIPNIFFVYGTETEIKSYFYENIRLPYLRFNYRFHNDLTKEPMVITDNQMKTLRIVCDAENKDTIVTTSTISKFNHGQRVRVTQGDFKDFEGIVARFKGQQRVGTVIDGVATVVTAYVPNSFIEVL